MALPTATLKYLVLLALGLIIAVVTYLLSQPVITETVVLNAILIAAAFLTQELEPSTPAPTAASANAGSVSTVAGPPS